MMYLVNNMAEKKKQRDKQLDQFVREKKKDIEEIELGYRIPDTSYVAKSPNTTMRTAPKQDITFTTLIPESLPKKTKPKTIKPKKVVRNLDDSLSSSCSDESDYSYKLN